ncbi:peptidogalycan biosysnthesis protein, partial [Acinetobacter baumannii]|uniref:peptidogalycan biosysnthesis protein n=1 Tax=Acinetobacter baumannii TaxID=470 RepID=UPI001488D484
PGHGAGGSDVNGDASSCTARERYNPFVAHAFYAALEASRSACARTGWSPQHLIARRGAEIVGVVPCYAKTHSRGEY